VKGEKTMHQTKRVSTKSHREPAAIDHLISSPSKDAELVQLKHQKIVNGACKVMFEKGYHLTTIREIAKACTMSMGQLYHYISCKDDILFLIHRHMQKLWYDQLENFGVKSIKNPIERLDKVIRHTQEFMVQNKKLIQFVYTESKYLDKRHLQVILEMDDKNVVGFYRRLLNEISLHTPLTGDLNFKANLIAYLAVFLALRGWNLKDKPVKSNIDSLRESIFQIIGLDVHDADRGRAKD
jgi:AcrR family transcriptional regulator